MRAEWVKGAPRVVMGRAPSGMPVCPTPLTIRHLPAAVYRTVNTVAARARTTQNRNANACTRHAVPTITSKQWRANCFRPEPERVGS
jgi:hypothetical protein